MRKKTIIEKQDEEESGVSRRYPSTGWRGDEGKERKIGKGPKNLTDKYTE